MRGWVLNEERWAMIIASAGDGYMEIIKQLSLIMHIFENFHSKRKLEKTNVPINDN